MRRVTLLSTSLAILVGLLGCTSEPLNEPPPSEQPTTGSAAPVGSSAPGDYVEVDYPPGPYGSVRGAILANQQFLGWRDPVGAGYDPAKFEVIRFSDFYNPAGTRGDIKLLVMDASAVWCTVCRLEYSERHMNGTYATYRAKGVELIGTLFEDNDYGPAKPEDLALWGDFQDHQVAFPLLLDPGFKMGQFFDGDVVPMNMIVDARTMQILNITMGYDANYWQYVDQLLATM